MNEREFKLMQFLEVGCWVYELPGGIGPATVNACYERGWVKLRRKTIKKEGDLETFRMLVCITERGETALSVERFRRSKKR